MKKLKQVKHKLKTWNKEVFGDVRVMKGQILKIIHKIDVEEARGVLRGRIGSGKEGVEGKIWGSSS